LQSGICGDLSPAEAQSLFLIKTFLPENAATSIMNLESWKNDIPQREYDNMRNWLLAL